MRKAWAELLEQYVPVRSAVLDLGCGTGSLSVLLAEQGHVVTGADLSPRMIEAARDKASRHATDVTLVVGDAAAPLVAGPFDVMLARHIVWALPDPSKALDNWRSLLPVGGRLVLIEGLWGNGAGLSATALQTLVEPKMREVEVRHLPDQSLWGQPINDERCILTARL